MGLRRDDVAASPRLPRTRASRAEGAVAAAADERSAVGAGPAARAPTFTSPKPLWDAVARSRGRRRARTAACRGAPAASAARTPQEEAREPHGRGIGCCSVRLVREYSVQRILSHIAPVRMRSSCRSRSPGAASSMPIDKADERSVDDEGKLSENGFDPHGDLGTVHGRPVCWRSWSRQSPGISAPRP